MRIGVPIEPLSAHAKPDGTSDGSSAPAIDPSTDSPILALLGRHIERLERELAMLVSDRDAERAQAGGTVAELQARVADFQVMLAETRVDRDMERLRTDLERDRRVVLADLLAEVVRRRDRPWWRRLTG